MKTLAIRLEDEQHARLTILAKLSDLSVTDAIRAAIDEHLAKLAVDPALAAKAEALTTAIEREATEQREAIKALFGATTDSPPASPRSTKSRN